MRHHWENKPFEPGSTRVVDQCTRCGLIRTRTLAGNDSYAGGFWKCVTVDERLNKQNELARIIDRHVRFFAPALLFFFASCFPPRHYAAKQVGMRMLAKFDNACRIYYSDTSFTKPLNEIR